MPARHAALERHAAAGRERLRVAVDDDVELTLEHVQHHVLALRDVRGDLGARLTHASTSAYWPCVAHPATGTDQLDRGGSSPPTLPPRRAHAHQRRDPNINPNIKGSDPFMLCEGFGELASGP